MEEDSKKKKENKNDCAIIKEAAQYHRTRRLKTAGEGANKGNEAVTMNVITGTLKFISGG